MTRVPEVAGPEVAGDGWGPWDNPAWASLRTRHAALSVGTGGVQRYHPDVAPFLGIPDAPTEQDWTDLAGLLRQTGVGALLRAPVPVPDGWARRNRIAVTELDGVQLTGAGLRTGQADDAGVVELGPADAAELLELTERTEPGPFRPRTVELGGYVGFRRDGKLVAMAGQRMSFPAGATGGWVEISAVCTDPAYRGQGLATRLMRVIAARARARGDEVFLHASAGNSTAIALYQHLGFTLRRPVRVTVFTPEYSGLRPAAVHSLNHVG